MVTLNRNQLISFTGIGWSLLPEFAASGNYTGPNDVSTPYLRQDYNLAMEYNTDHTIKKKTQVHSQGLTSSYGGTITKQRPVYKTSYELNYADYGKGKSYVAGTSYGYLQPHAPATITEYPSWVTDPVLRETRAVRKEILYDANGNQTEIKEKVGDVKTSVRKNLWDEENRLMAVDLKPDDTNAHPIAIYTYSGGDRVIRYNQDRVSVSSNAAKIGENSKDNVMIYPSGLLMGKVYHSVNPKGERIDRIRYTKHYYIGSERISAKTGTVNDMEKVMGWYPSSLVTANMPGMTSIRVGSDAKVTNARVMVDTICKKFGQPNTLLTGIREGTLTAYEHTTGDLKAFYFHPDHLGSSSYITNGDRMVSQHMEYLPFGETLVDEHTNSINSPYKFNGKEKDEETNNYYYGARYYDPKWSIFISVDPLAEKYPSISSYAYVANNPINAIDPDGRDIIFIVRGKTRNEDRSMTYKNGNAYWNDSGKKYDGKGGNSTVNSVLSAYQKIENSNDDVLKNQLHTLEKSKNHHFVEEGTDSGVEGRGIGIPKEGDKIGSVTTFDFSEKAFKDFEKSEGVSESVFSIVVHELRHQFDYDTGNMKDRKTPSSATSPQEIRAVNNENRARKIEGLPARTKYNGVKIDPKLLENPPKL